MVKKRVHKTATAFIVGGIFILLGSTFLIFGAISWGLVDVSRLGFTTFYPNDERTPKLIKVLGVSSTIVGTILLILGLSLCTLTPQFLLHRIGKRVRQRRLLRCLYAVSQGPNSASNSSPTATGSRMPSVLPVDIKGDHPFDPRSRANTVQLRITNTENPGLAEGKHGIGYNNLKPHYSPNFKCQNKLQTLVELGEMNILTKSKIHARPGSRTKPKRRKEISCSAGDGDSFISSTSTPVERQSQESLRSVPNNAPGVTRALWINASTTPLLDTSTNIPKSTDGQELMV